jgi:dipeptidyl aminopeptidase/acylaminoacyl peptidase
MTSRDLLRLHMVSDPQVSPDGRSVAWVRTWIDAEANRYRSALMLTSIVTRETRALTDGTAVATHPRWSPEGAHLAYLAIASGQDPPRAADVPQLWILNLASGGTWPLSDLRYGARDLAWSPDGSVLAGVTRVNPRRGLELTGDAAREDAEPYVRFNQDVQIVRRMRWKADGAGFFGDTWKHIVLVPFADSDGARALPEPRLLTLDEFDLGGPAWSPDGAMIAAVGNVRPDADASRAAFIYLLDPAGPSPARPREIFGLPEMRKQEVSWSPDGRYLAVCGHDVPRIGHYGNQRLWIVEVAGGAARCVSPHLDRTIGDYSRNQDVRGYGGDDRARWLPDGDGLLVLINECGTVHLNEFTLKDGRTAALTEGDRVISAFSVDPNHKTIVALIEDELNPGDLYLVPRDPAPEPGQPASRLTDVNHEYFVDVAPSRPVRFQFDSDGVTVDGWIVPPLDREPGRRYPAILYAGGGPGGMRAAVYVHEFQVYAAEGYAVVYCNARGNQGYGEAFAIATRGRWGDQDYDDNMACIRAACDRFEYIDRNRLAVAGGSYGGYMTLWIISHSQAFRAAVVDRTLFNRYSMTGTSDMGFLLDGVEFDGQRPWEARQTFLERSPFHYVANIRTPTLVVHSDADLRCPVEQGEQLYMALKRLGVPTEFVRFPGESHDLSRNGGPWHRVFRLDRYLDWFRRWL